MSDRIYLDFNASTPVAPEVAAAMSPFLEEAYGNPSSLHWAGLAARDAIELARSQVAALLCCDATEIVFTSGGTEANNQAIKGSFFARRPRGGPFHVITSRVEHPAVLEPCRFLESLGAEVTRLSVDCHGLVDPDDVRRAIRPHTALVSIMHANNEVGTIQPLIAIAAIAREHGILCHTDAAQTVGKIPVDVESLGVDLLSVAGHKLYGPKGVGALFVREGIELEPLLHGAGHEAGRRAGTENVLEIVGLGAACELAQSWVDDHRVAELRDGFWRALQSHFSDRVVLNGHAEYRLPNTLNVSFRGLSGNEILARASNVAASTGSACHAGANHISPVLEAMGVANDVGHGAVRFSLGRSTTQAEIEAVVEVLRGSANGEVGRGNELNRPLNGSLEVTRILLRWSLAIVCVGGLVASTKAVEHTKDSLQAVKDNVAEEKAVLVDVREKSEWNGGRISGAVFLPLSELRNGIDSKTLLKKLPKGRIVYTHCAVGKRSLTAAGILQKHGYDARPLKAGYADLLRAGFQKAEK